MSECLNEPMELRQVLNVYKNPKIKIFYKTKKNPKMV